jgi:hypothetical protein
MAGPLFVDLPATKGGRSLRLTAFILSREGILTYVYAFSHWVLIANGNIW